MKIFGSLALTIISFGIVIWLGLSLIEVNVHHYESGYQYSQYNVFAILAGESR